MGGLQNNFKATAKKDNTEYLNILPSFNELSTKKRRKKSKCNHNDDENSDECNCNYSENKTILYIVSIIGVCACVGLIIWIIVTICKKNKSNTTQFMK